jgi:uncharacterized repeat protein (TIGR02543 family)
MKKTCCWLSLLMLILLIPSLSWAVPPIPAGIGGTVTIDGTALTQATDDGLVVEVVDANGDAYDPVAEDTDGLNGSGAYTLDIPIYDATEQPDGATAGDTAIIKVTINDVEYTVTSPTDGEITVGASGSTTQIDVVAVGPKTLTITASDLGDTTPAEGTEHEYDHGEVVSITAEAASGYTFTAWTGDTDNIADTSSASTTITMNADAVIEATYIVCTKALTMAVNNELMGSVDPAAGTSDQSCDAVVPISATPEAGYFFVSWTGDVADSTSADTTVTMDADQSVTANFAEITYTLTVTEPTNGSITLDPDEDVYAEDQVVTVTAVPSTGYLFSEWTGDVADASSASTTVTMDADKTIGATFTACTKTLDMSVNDTQMGSTDPEGETTQSCDASVSITATPEDGYSFVNWTGDVADANSATTTVTMDVDQEVMANFVATTYILTIGSAANGSVSLSPAAEDDDGTNDAVEDNEYEYAEGAVVTLTATADTDYAFAGWTGDVANSRLSTTTVTIDSDKTITPSFLGDTDGDGKDDTSEYGADGTDTDYDGNDDGTADAEQANVVSTYNADGSVYVTIATDASNTMTATPIENPDETEAPSDVTMDYGFFDISITGLTAGDAATVTIILPEDADEPDTYYKYGPTSDDSTDHWYEFTYDSDTETGAEFDGNVITLNFVDGLRGDSDLTANGTIDDPGAPGRVAAAATASTDDDNCFIATASSGSQNINTYGVAASVAGFLFLMVFGFARYRRK